ncbi:MAG: alpha/beta hydrolase [Clostridiaceae bacterium]|nr:alpha/beta hydrolase [Clostridiaceae bacterium]
MKIILTILGGAFLVLIIAAACYIYNNMNYDKNVAYKLKKAGFTEKQAVLPDGTVLGYGEGHDNGPALFLIHGQMTSWEDYVKVLPELSKHFHIFAVDCHGHGASSKDPAKYSAEAMGKDFIWFMENIIKEPSIVSGHSSGGLLTAWLAANSPENVKGIVLEDPPFFATEPDRCKKTYAWLDGFEPIHRFLNQTEVTDYVRFYLDNTYLQNFFGNAWNGIKKHANQYMEKNPNKRLRIFFLPPSLNRSFDLITGDYDLRFGDTFYDCSWFDNFNQAETLSRINCPSVLIHTSWSYSNDGVLLAAMDENDAQRAHELIPGNELINVKSGHDFHYEKPKEFNETMSNFLFNYDNHRRNGDEHQS